MESMASKTIRQTKMNTQTQQALIEFADAVEQLASAGQLIIGLDTTSELIYKCEALKLALNKDNTITEAR